MMAAIGQYLLHLTAAALICGIVTAFFGKKGPVGGVIQLLAGIFLTLNMISPWVQLRLQEWSDVARDFVSSGETLRQQGENTARNEMARRITERTQAYILDKAEALQVSLSVEVELDDGAVPAPCGVRIRGKVSPYAKKVLGDWLTKELGIAPEEQIWT